MSEAIESLSLRAAETPSPGGPDWLDRLRTEALAIANEQGIPTRRLEEWKGTSLAPLEAMRFSRIGPSPSAPGPDAARTLACELVFVDGRFDAAASTLDGLPDGVHAASLEAVRRDQPALLEGRLAAISELKGPSLVALQTAFAEDGAVISIGRGVEAELPIRMRFVSTADATDRPSAAFPRLLVIAEQESRATLFQDFVSDGDAPGLTAFVAELHLESGARVETVQLQAECASRIHYSHLQARLARDARLDSTVLTLGAGLVRSELEVVLAEPGAETRMHGFFLGREAGHVDHFTTVDHAAPHCTSDEEYRGVLADRSRGVFRGRVIVRPDAQKTDARQSNPNILLSDRASIDTKPQLEIYADDIKASHGSTIGQLDADALFFLRARGIGEADARLLLTRGFAHGVVDQIGHDALATELRERIDATLVDIVATPVDIVATPGDLVTASARDEGSS